MWQLEGLLLALIGWLVQLTRQIGDETVLGWPCNLGFAEQVMVHIQVWTLLLLPLLEVLP